MKTADEKYAELRRRDYELFRDVVAKSTVVVCNGRLDDRTNLKLGSAIELAMVDLALRMLDRVKEAESELCPDHCEWRCPEHG